VVPTGQFDLTVAAQTAPVSAEIGVRAAASFGGRAKGREVLVKKPDLRILYAQSVIRGC